MTIIFCSESVDQSATYLAQALDGDMEVSTGDIPDSILDEDNNIIFYGALRLPEEFRFDGHRMFNNPRVARRLLNKKDVMDILSRNQLNAATYIRLNRDLTFTEACRLLNTRSLDLVSKSGLNIVSIATRAGDYNNNRRAAHWVRPAIDINKKYRLFIGLPNLTEGTSLIGASFTEKRMLTYRESLLLGQPAEAQRALLTLFEAGRIPEDAGQGHEAWTDTEVLTRNTLADLLPDYAQMVNISRVVQSVYETDFCAIDVVGSPGGTLTIVSATGSPSLQDEGVLHMVADYHREMLEFGRRITGNQLANMVRDLSEEQITQVVAFLRQNNMSGRATLG